MQKPLIELSWRTSANWPEGDRPWTLPLAPSWSGSSVRRSRADIILNGRSAPGSPPTTRRSRSASCLEAGGIAEGSRGRNPRGGAGMLAPLDMDAVRAKVAERLADHGEAILMPRIQRTERAEVDLIEILVFLRSRSPRWLAIASKSISKRRLPSWLQFPLMGRDRGDLAPRLRSSLVKPYVLLYRPLEDGIEIIRVIHGARDISSLLRVTMKSIHDIICSWRRSPPPRRRPRPRPVPLGPERPLVASGDMGRRSVPGTGARVQIRSGHTVVTSTSLGDSADPVDPRRRHAPVRPREDTRLDVGLIKIQAGDDPGESGFNCEGHAMAPPGTSADRTARPWRSARRTIRSPPAIRP